MVDTVTHTQLIDTLMVDNSMGFKVERKDQRLEKWWLVETFDTYNEASAFVREQAGTGKHRIKPADRWLVLANGVLESCRSKESAQRLRNTLTTAGVPSHMVSP